eukprot:CAMPEP_0198737314 /NCGR_PEP_ID=MMETSP1475-20131203/67805_1 /TAXON_ID= ORGANISM="Unidentified sp., Strain CCMP1999" /NCGR_SAMPLE_ID=MMETSP1475 /ASSEMBLY_ACC=CAM_ASM_001111 /LENGTH=94 /DNA_ID=CAMNT_0044501175 /DNA_START=843 /DNA_END=1127 /DNA_ORIENTATION=+
MSLLNLTLLGSALKRLFTVAVTSPSCMSSAVTLYFVPTQAVLLKGKITDLCPLPAFTGTADLTSSLWPTILHANRPSLGAAYDKLDTNGPLEPK